MSHSRDWPPSPFRLELGLKRTEPKATGDEGSQNCFSLPFPRWSLVWPALGVGLGAGLAGWPWVEGNEENQLGGNYSVVGSGTHDTVFIEYSLQFLILLCIKLTLYWPQY